MRTLSHLAAMSLVALLVCSTAAMAQPSPETIYKSAVNNGNVRGPVEQKAAGEQFCWHANTSVRHFVRGYKAYGDTAWLDWGVKYYDFLISAMQTGPDGYKGWVGPYIYSPTTRWADVHVGDAVLMEGILEFSELVLKDDQLKQKYGDKAREYVRIAKRDVMEKWDSRGTWYEDGEIGGYTVWNVFAKPGQVKEWAEDPTFNSGSLPFNKNMDMGMVSLAIYRITGEEAYRERARKIFNFIKARMTLNDDHYTWNYWEPLGQMDIDLKARREGGSGLRHWVNTHGYRNYQAGEVKMIVEAYHSGITFDRRDIELLIATNLKVMWNGDKDDPKFANSNARLPRPELTPEQKKAQQEAEAANKYAKEGRAGTLWTPLADFDPTIRQLYARQLEKGSGSIAELNKAYFKKVTAAREPGFDRHHADLPVSVYTALPARAAALTLAAALPSVVEAGKTTLLVSKANLPGKLEVNVMSADGEKMIATLHSGDVPGGTDGHAGVFILPWNLEVDGKRLDPGSYRIRWTFGGQSTDYPLTVK